jgi:hypothetical protein
MSATPRRSAARACPRRTDQRSGTTRNLSKKSEKAHATQGVACILTATRDGERTFFCADVVGVTVAAGAGWLVSKGTSWSLFSSVGVSATAVLAPHPIDGTTLRRSGRAARIHGLPGGLTRAAWRARQICFFFTNWATAAAALVRRAVRDVKPSQAVTAVLCGPSSGRSKVLGRPLLPETQRGMWLSGVFVELVPPVDP